MASYLRNWLYSQYPGASAPAVQTPTIVETAPPIEDDDDDASTVRGDDDDVPPAFPALNSAQRATSSSAASATPRVLTDAQRMPPPPPPSLVSRRPGATGGASSSSLMPPPTTTKPPAKPSKRGKVALAPGHGPLDWANLKKSGQDLRGTDTLLRVTPSMLKEHRSKDDAWTAISGKVYNITHYLPYHPGGEKELMRVAGRDGTKLFALTHAWVNADMMLDECLVGFLVPESG